MNDEQKAQLFTISVDAGDYDLTVGYAYNLDAAKEYAVNRPLSDYEEDYLTLDEVVQSRGAWEWKERTTGSGEKINGRWTNGVETIRAVSDVRIAGQHPAVAELARLRTLLADLHAMAYEDIRTGDAPNNTCIWSVEAETRSALGLPSDFDESMFPPSPRSELKALRALLDGVPELIEDMASSINYRELGYIGDEEENRRYRMAHNIRLALSVRADQGEKKTDAQPIRVCLCGSTRFSQAFQEANLRETLAGNIVLTIGCDMRSDADLFADKSEDDLKRIKADLDTLHLRKIDLADEVLILNVGGYIGESTRRELNYARANGKRVRFLESDEQL